MDVSVFIGNKKRFWTWILLPLIARFVLVSAVFGVTEKSLIHCAEEQAADRVVSTLQEQCDKNKILLEYYEVDPIFPINEQLYQFFAEKNSEYNLDMKGDVAVTKQANDKISLYSMNLSGMMPSIYVISAFFADVQADPLLSLQRCSYSDSQRGRNSDALADGSLKVDCEFEKLALTKTGGRSK